MRELSLFSGAGGGLLGTKLLGWKHCGYVEYNDYCQKVIAQRIKDGFLDEAPIFGDIRAFIDQGFARSYQGMVDVVSAGFPCQPFSVAGKGLAEDDPRNMWPQTIETIRQVRPRYALLENVPGLLAHPYFGTILGDLDGGGYSCVWKRLSAAEIGAPHFRDRLFIVAHSNANGIGCNHDWNATPKGHKNGFTPLHRTKGLRADVADSVQDECVFGGIFNGYDGKERTWGKSAERCKNWNGFEMGPAYYPVSLEREIYPPGTDGMVDGVADWLDSVEATGNGQVPAVVKAVWELMGPQ